MAKSKKEKALESLTPKQKEAYDLVATAGGEGIRFETLFTKLGVVAKNMVYTRMNALVAAGVVKKKKDGREVVYYTA